MLLSFRTACPVCATDCIRGACPHHGSFVGDIALRDVVEAANDLLDLEHGRERAAA
jgi:hypothetical protein